MEREFENFDPSAPTEKKPESTEAVRSFNPEREITSENWEKIAQGLEDLRQKAESYGVETAIYIKSLAELQNISPQKAAEYVIPDEMATRAIKWVQQNMGFSEEQLEFLASLKKVLPSRTQDFKNTTSRLGEIMRHAKEDLEFCRTRNYSSFLYKAAKMREEYEPNFREYISRSGITDQDWDKIVQEVKKNNDPVGMANNAAWLKIVSPEHFDRVNLDDNDWANMKSRLQPEKIKRIEWRFSYLEHASNLATISK